MFQQTAINKGRRPSLQGPKKMQIPLMGLEQNQHQEQAEEE